MHEPNTDADLKDWLTGINYECVVKVRRGRLRLRDQKDTRSCPINVIWRDAMTMAQGRTHFFFVTNIEVSTLNPDKAVRFGKVLDKISASPRRQGGEGGCEDQRRTICALCPSVMMSRLSEGNKGKDIEALLLLLKSGIRGDCPHTCSYKVSVRRRVGMMR